MPDATRFGLFLVAATILAITPGPGIFYVLTRSIRGGRREGIASALGTAIGGLVHVFAAAFGLSAVLATSIVAFNIVKYVGAAYLVYLGVRLLLSREQMAIDTASLSDRHNAVRQGILTEILNPKTALFFLAFIPQFVNPTGLVFLQFLLLGSLSIFLNTSVDMIVALLAGSIGRWLQTNVRVQQGQRLFSGSALIGLGTYVAVANDGRS